ncbi:MAG TPA: type II secretion system protein [Candidatus Methylomirabilis sp.]
MSPLAAQDARSDPSGCGADPRRGAGPIRSPRSARRPADKPALRHRRGLTLIEVLVTLSILGVLASVALPLHHLTVKRNKELELRRGLRTMRIAIDQFKLEYDKVRANARDAKEIFKSRVSLDRTGYPLTLQELVDAKIVRRVPRDPMNPQGKWVTRSYSDNPESSIGDEKDVFDVRSASTAEALDGTTYDTW